MAIYIYIYTIIINSNSSIFGKQHTNSMSLEVIPFVYVLIRILKERERSDWAKV